MKNYQIASEIELVKSGSDYFERLEELINGSRDVFHLQTYIFDCDETGIQIIRALIQAAQRGVKVFLMVDAYGSKFFPEMHKSELLAAGVNFRIFSPLFSAENRSIGRRMHHKIAVADKLHGLVTGINIADKYNSNKGKAWLDFGIYIKGEVNEYLYILCKHFYLKKNLAALRKWERENTNSVIQSTSLLVRFRRNDWLWRSNEIHRSYVEAIAKAEKSIVIVASYFLPGNNFRKLLRKAAAKGVQIKILVAGKTDLPTVKLAENYLIEFYLSNNIQIFEWHESVLHGKAMIVDDHWATIGSYNLNFLSHYFSTELNADVIDKKFIKTFSDELSEIILRHCHKIDLMNYQQNQNPIKSILQWLSYNILRLIRNTFMLGRKFRINKDN